MKVILRSTLLLTTAVLLTTCAIKPKGTFGESPAPLAPDYSKTEDWAALPTKFDPADMTPNGLEDEQASAPVDVFFLHPTIYEGKLGEDQWNGPINDPKLNKRIDESTIQYQASIFNGIGRVYAPRYRQAHIKAYTTTKTASAEKAFDLAYEDVRTAFEYYLAHYNNGRPIVIASHSQGSTHAKRLIKEFFDGTPLQSQLVAAYLVGMPILKDEYDHIPVCETPDQTGCFCTWRTWKFGKEPKKWVSPDVAVTNPLSWTTSAAYVPKAQNKGSVLRDFEKVLPELGDAQIQPDLGILLTHRPKVFASIFLNGNYHIADFNLYYLNVRENVKERVQQYLRNELMLSH
ncbi:MAG: DUF3089 domain-containing protein [Saprospiraceae bacterium]|nr:DUF3089 domain-containing protein [Saprospiraceae bacterium]